VTGDHEIVMIGMGSNLGNRQQHFKKAIFHISRIVNTTFLACSSLYNTEPLGMQKQPVFLNAVISLKTSHEPYPFLQTLQRIEKMCGRTRQNVRWGPRVLDLDILFWGKEIIHAPDLHVPHPEIPRRNFVLVPLCEIDPHWIHPEMGLTVTELLNRSPDPSIPVVESPDPDTWNTIEDGEVVIPFASNSVKHRSSIDNT
jgi:2-amino-4-hydroxy-6-hydroxymethyldihydropteridine diphosphokinase